MCALALLIVQNVRIARFFFGFHLGEHCTRATRGHLSRHYVPTFTEMFLLSYLSIMRVSFWLCLFLSVKCQVENYYISLWLHIVCFISCTQENSIQTLING